MDQGFRRGFSRRNLLIPTQASAFHPPTAFRTSDVGCPFMSAEQTFSTRSLTSENDPKRPSATHSRLHFGRPEPWEGRLAALWLCAEHDRQLGGESLLSSLMVAKD